MAWNCAPRTEQYGLRLEQWHQSLRHAAGPAHAPNPVPLPAPKIAVRSQLVSVTLNSCGGAQKAPFRNTAVNLAQHPLGLLTGQFRYLVTVSDVGTAYKLASDRTQCLPRAHIHRCNVVMQPPPSVHHTFDRSRTTGPCKSSYTRVNKQ